MRFRTMVLSTLVALSLGSMVMSRAEADAPTIRIHSLELVPTFESVGVSLTLDGPLDDLSAECSFRAAGATAWRPALDPVACPDEHQFRGSVLRLAADTRYEIRVRVRRAGPEWAEQTADVRTWSEAAPIAREIVLPPGVSTQPLVISDRGSPTGWIRYRAAPQGTIIDAGTNSANAVRLDHAAYVIVEGLTLRGGASDAVSVVDSHDVRVRNCDIAGWGDPGRWGYYSDHKHHQWAFLDAAGKMIDHQAGVRVRGAGSTRVVIEGNLIHHPRGTANCWAFLHPHGPEGVVLSETGGNHVVRYNDMIAGDGHRWNDAIASEYNGEVIGGPYRDTDIYGNLLMDPNDDGTELDGGQINVRFWGNRIEGGYCGLSCAPNLRGPSYAFRNVIVTGDERGASGAGFKMGGDPGVTFLVNNTVYTNGHGLTSGHYGKNPSRIFSRNNVFAGPEPAQGRVRFDRAVAGDLDHDVIPPGGLLGPEKPIAGREAGAVFARPEFVAAGQGDFRFSAGSPATGAGVAVPTIATAGENPGALAPAWRAGSWPIRPGAPEVLPNRVVVRVRAGERATAVLQVTAPKASRAWRPIAGEPWVSFSSAGGAAAPTRSLACRIDARELSPGLHRTFVAVRAENGGLRSVPLIVEVTPREVVSRRFEPAATDGAFAAARVAGAGGGAGVRVLENPDTAKPLTLAFDLAKAGRFFVRARVRATGPAARIARQDSLTLQVDDGAVMTWQLFGLSDGAWTWTTAKPMENISGVFPLAAGSHRLRVGAREPGVLLDAIVISNDPFAE